MNKANLVLHCGARAVDRETLSAVPCPEPTESWHPISHIHLVNEIERSLVASSMQIVNESFGLTEDGARMFGLLQVANCVDTKDYAYVIGVRGATDKTLSRGLAVGSSVFVCDNMAFSAEITMFRKQTKNILDDLPLMVDTAIGQLGSRWNDQQTRIDTYKRTAINNQSAAYMLLEMAEDDVFPHAKLSSIYNEFKAPRHEEFGKENLWALFNSVTEFLKPRPESKATGLWTMPARTGRLHKVCDDFAGIVSIEVEATVEPVVATAE